MAYVSENEMHAVNTWADFYCGFGNTRRRAREVRVLGWVFGWGRVGVGGGGGVVGWDGICSGGRGAEALEVARKAREWWYGELRVYVQQIEI